MLYIQTAEPLNMLLGGERQENHLSRTCEIQRKYNKTTPHSSWGKRKEGCQWLSAGLTDWNFSAIASSLLRTDRNLGTPPTKQETWFGANVKPFVSQRLLQMGGILLAFNIQSGFKQSWV